MKLRAGVLALAMLPGVARPDPALDALRDAYYRFEVAGYCSLVSAAVARGFHAEVRSLGSTLVLDHATVDRLRGEAWQAAHAEWQNRGLGGFRGWCRVEGTRYAEGFAARDRGCPPPC